MAKDEGRGGGEGERANERGANEVGSNPYIDSTPRHNASVSNPSRTARRPAITARKREILFGVAKHFCVCVWGGGVADNCLYVKSSIMNYMKHLEEELLV